MKSLITVLQHFFLCNKNERIDSKDPRGFFEDGTASNMSGSSSVLLIEEYFKPTIAPRKHKQERNGNIRKRNDIPVCALDKKNTIKTYRLLL